MDTRREDVFHLNVSFNLDVVQYPEISGALGTVTEIPNDFVAVVNVESEVYTGRIMCFRKCLQTPCLSLKNVLKVGDTLSLRLRSASGLYDCKDWFVLQAAKVAEEELKQKLEISQRPNCSEMSFDQGKVGESCHSGTLALRRVPWRKFWKSGDRRFLLNWPGVVQIDAKTGKAGIRVEHAFGSSKLDLDDPVFQLLTDNERMDCARLSSFINRRVFFDAELVESAIVMKNIWFEERRASYSLLLPYLNCNQSLSPLDVFYCGKIILIPFHDCAIATVGGVPVLVPLESLVTEDVMNSSSTTINMFVDVGCVISTTLKRQDQYFVADKCWRMCTSNQSRDIRAEEERDGSSWLDVWGGAGEFVQQGVLDEKDGKLMINLNSSNFVMNGDVFINQRRAAPCQLKDVTGRRISCLVRRAKYFSEEKYIACAWLGRPVSPLSLLKDSLAVPGGLVAEAKCYDAILADFPLPTHAICRIGAVPVLLPLSQLVPLSPTCMRRGDVISVSVSERIERGCTYLVSKSASGPHCGSLPVMVNFTGSVVRLPRPLGIIKADVWDFVVYFELCCVQAAESGAEDVFSCFEYVKSKMTVGTKVRFTAKTDLEPRGRRYLELDPVGSVFYQAVEVRINDET